MERGTKGFRKQYEALIKRGEDFEEEADQFPANAIVDSESEDADELLE